MNETTDKWRTNKRSNELKIKKTKEPMIEITNELWNKNINEVTYEWSKYKLNERCRNKWTIKIRYERWI